MRIIEHDFGKEKREAPRRLRSLLRLDALHDTNIRSNPVPYLERASERIYQLEKALFDAVQAGKATRSGKSITIDKTEYDALKAALAIIKNALAACQHDEEPA